MSDYTPAYQNVMETLVEEEYSKVKDALGCCTCERCHGDIVAYALNQLPPKYVVTPKGEVYSKTFILRSQHRTDIMAALAKAAAAVRAHPRHE